jgi:hypothetical protein
VRRAPNGESDARLEVRKKRDTSPQLGGLACSIYHTNLVVMASKQDCAVDIPQCCQIPRLERIMGKNRHGIEQKDNAT